VWNAINHLKHAHDLDYVGNFLRGADLKEFWADAKEVSDTFRETKPMRRSDREELWEEFQRICEWVREMQEQKHEEWVERNREHLDRWHAQIDKGEDMIERLKGQIDHCEDLKTDATSDDFADQVQGWIDEKERIIDDIESRNSEPWEKIRDVEARLRGKTSLPMKIDLKNITVRELVEGYSDKTEMGVRVASPSLGLAVPEGRSNFHPGSRVIASRWPVAP